MCPGYPHKHDTFTSFQRSHIFPRPRLTCFGACANCSPHRPGLGLPPPPDQRAYSSCTPGHYIANDGIDWKLCVRIVLELYYLQWHVCFFTIMLAEFLNIKHSHSHCEWYTLIKRQCCDWLLSVASWTFALISYETVTVRDTQCSVSSADQTWSSTILRPAPAAPLCGPTWRRRRCRRSGWRTQS